MTSSEPDIARIQNITLASVESPAGVVGAPNSIRDLSGGGRIIVGGRARAGGGNEEAGACVSWGEGMIGREER